MIKILSRMSNMVYYRAWSCWYNATIRIHQMSIDEEIKMLRAEVKDARAQAEVLETEAQARADEASALAIGNASESQRKLILMMVTHRG